MATREGRHATSTTMWECEIGRLRQGFNCKAPAPKANADDFTGGVGSACGDASVCSRRRRAANRRPLTISRIVERRRRFCNIDVMAVSNPSVMPPISDLPSRLYGRLETYPTGSGIRENSDVQAGKSELLRVPLPGLWLLGNLPHSYPNVPLVLGTPVTRGSASTAIRKARAVALKIASLM